MSFESQGTEGATLQPEAARKIRNKILKWGRSNYQNFPWREPIEAWHGLLAEILLQRTRAENVVPVYLNFISEFKSLQALANSSVDKIETIIHPLGLRWRATFIKQLGEQLLDLNGIIPEDYYELLKLPGVGDYAASAWLSFHGGQRRRIVDANIVRLICRITGSPMNGETRRQKWLIDIAESLTPLRLWKSYNYSVLDFTIMICSKKPLCNKCPIGQNFCNFGKQYLEKIPS